MTYVHAVITYVYDCVNNLCLLFHLTIIFVSSVFIQWYSILHNINVSKINTMLRTEA